eukprot:gnl/TRDRNA2_/TRDRNA2_179994_c0_seq1.p1 gnl/TRDRNA2_/TRDRNA2_179994_c0~~gnl/TRDRNA2_/TRDRNA2_179994_c0_seq1.p1  ORF type:complete len:192 (+),score=58.37 gnl/TRDRNA2_/TRDRNA2_179994_c0_seq1:94-669(+)
MMTTMMLLLLITVSTVLSIEAHSSCETCESEADELTLLQLQGRTKAFMQQADQAEVREKDEDAKDASQNAAEDQAEEGAEEATFDEDKPNEGSALLQRSKAMDVRDYSNMVFENAVKEEMKKNPKTEAEYARGNCDPGQICKGDGTMWSDRACAMEARSVPVFPCRPDLGRLAACHCEYLDDEEDGPTPVE